jgi:hypothetical protein
MDEGVAATGRAETSVAAAAITPLRTGDRAEIQAIVE